MNPVAQSQDKAIGLLEGHKEYECWIRELDSVPLWLSLIVFSGLICVQTSLKYNNTYIHIARTRETI